jgi:CRP/FNR family cyclic AMP-dependent transcriptional regulator
VIFVTLWEIVIQVLCSRGSTTFLKDNRMKKILIIEDNLYVRENLVEILELSNYQTATAENGIIGVEKAKANPPNLILCDVMMPELDGYGVLNILEKNSKTAGIPFIFLTGRAERSDFRKGMNLGAEDYITKPFDQSELLDVIERRIKKSERIKKAFDGTQQGLNAFINETRGLKELEKLTEERTTKEYKKKEKIFQEGDLPKKLYFIATGKVKTYKTNEAGKEYITGVHEPGEFLGYLSLIKDRPFAYSAACMKATTLSIIPKGDFFRMLHYNQNFSARFIKMLANNIQEKEEKLLSLAYNSIRKRVAKTLIKLAKKQKGKPYTLETDKLKVGVKNDGHFVTILREDLANIVGTAQESVIRTLTDFKNEGLVEVDHSLIHILELEKLHKLKG